MKEPGRSPASRSQLQLVHEPLNATMPGYRAPIASKGKQRIGALSCGKRPIQFTAAVSTDPSEAVRGTNLKAQILVLEGRPSC